MIKYNWTPLTEWSARRRDPYLYNTQQAQDSNTHTVSGIRTCDPSNRKPKTHALGLSPIYYRNGINASWLSWRLMNLVTFIYLSSYLLLRSSKQTAWIYYTKVKDWKTIVSGSQFGTQLCDTAKNATPSYLTFTPVVPQLCGRRPESRTINQISKQLDRGSNPGYPEWEAWVQTRTTSCSTTNLSGIVSQTTSCSLTTQACVINRHLWNWHMVSSVRTQSFWS